MHHYQLGPYHQNYKEQGFARAALHYWEEPGISGEEGSGTVFFTGCTLRCVFCQNREISFIENCAKEIGTEVSIDRLVEIYFELKEKGANNINLVTPTHYLPSIKESIIKARARGFDLPFVYNTSGYERVESLKELDGLIDIYLPDMKYYDNSLAIKYSNAKNYREIASAAIREMYRQVGNCEFDDNGIMKKGVMVRHLILPGHTSDSKEVIKYLYNEYHDNIYISIMNQYTPISRNLINFSEIDRKITEGEYDEVVDFAIEIGVENGYIQEGETVGESFIPAFDGEGV